MPARRSRRSGFSRASGATTSIPAPTSSTCTCGVSARSSAQTSWKPCGVRAIGSMAADRDWPTRRFTWVDGAWFAFAIANLAAMLVFSEWETVPFHFIWVSLTLLYGFRVWRMGPTLWLLAGVMVLTGTALTIDFARGAQPLDELTEVPL